MNIDEAIEKLQKVKDAYPKLDIEVFFDCPICKGSFTPDRISTVKSTVFISPKR